MLQLHCTCSPPSCKMVANITSIAINVCGCCECHTWRVTKMIRSWLSNAMCWQRIWSWRGVKGGIPFPHQNSFGFQGWTPSYPRKQSELLLESRSTLRVLPHSTVLSQPRRSLCRELHVVGCEASSVWKARLVVDWVALFLVLGTRDRLPQQAWDFAYLAIRSEQTISQSCSFQMVLVGYARLSSVCTLCGGNDVAHLLKLFSGLPFQGIWRRIDGSHRSHVYHVYWSRISVC